MKSIFAQHGIPEVVVSDNGPQYSSELFRQFANEYGFLHTTSSPHYPQANWEAERAVKTIKSMLHREANPYLALLAYRTTPTAVGYTPSELLMSRKLRTTVPITRDLRKPKVPDFSAVAERDKEKKQKQAENFNSRHGTKHCQHCFPEIQCTWQTEREWEPCWVRLRHGHTSSRHLRETSDETGAK